MSMHDVFLADIVANPDDDAPRLVYADWLDENGDPERAQFIRVQCRLASLGQYDLERYGLEGEEAALWRKNEKKWRKQLAKITARVVFRRGFPDTIALPTAKFVTHGQEALDIAPTLREYRVLQPAPAWDRLLRCDALARLRSLDAGHHRLGMGRVQALARCPHLANLRELSLSSSAMRPSGMAELAACRYLSNLRKLDLMSSHVGDAAVERLVESPHLKNVTDLDLSHNELTPAAIARLARWEGARRPEAIALAEAEQGDQWARAFAGGEWPALRKLTFQFNRMKAAGVEALARCPSLAGLRQLKVPLWSSHLKALVESPYLTNLEGLDVLGKVDGEPLRALAGSALLGNLRSLSLDGGDPAGIAAVLAGAGALRELKLEGPGAGPMVPALAAAANLVNLRRLSIIQGGIGPVEARLLANAPHLAGLVELNLAGCAVNEAAARELLASPHLKCLRSLSLFNSPVILKGAIVEQLRERFGELTVG